MRPAPLPYVVSPLEVPPAGGQEQLMVTMVDVPTTVDEPMTVPR